MRKQIIKNHDIETFMSFFGHKHKDVCEYWRAKNMIKTKVVNTLRYVFVEAAVFFRERGKEGFLFKELLKCCKKEEIVFFYKKIRGQINLFAHVRHQMQVTEHS